MLIKDFTKLKREKTPKQMIALHTHNLIYLTDKQLNEVLRLKNKD
jgi:hypothetical protein